MELQTDLEGNHLGSQDPPWKGICCSQCWNAKGTRCTCSCGGAFHGIGHGHSLGAKQKHLVGKHGTILSLEQAQPFLGQMKRPRCSCDEDLRGSVIFAYPHEHGWTVPGFDKKQWLFIVCPKCGHQNPLWQLGVPRQ